jgi:hypothetical protein
MEKLKPLAEVCQPDVRYRNRVDLDHSTGTISETTIEGIYRLIEPIELTENVPEEVRSHFEIARNLALYSWFVYSFNVVAAMHAYASLEMALKQKAGKKRISLKKSLAKHFKGRQLTGGLGPPIDLSEAVSSLPMVSQLQKKNGRGPPTSPALRLRVLTPRNHFAHRGGGRGQSLCTTG